MRRLQLVHSDVCGPMPTESVGGNRYFVNFVNDYSRCFSVYFLDRGDEVPNKFKLFDRGVVNDSCQKIALLRSNNGGKYLYQKFGSYLESKGVNHELAVPCSREQNNVAERMNRTLLEPARSMMVHAGLPDKFLPVFLECVAYIRNRFPTFAIKGNKTTLEGLSLKKPDVHT